MKRFHEASEAYYESPEYAIKVERLQQILEPVRDKRIGWDLEGVLINRSPFGSVYPLDESWKNLGQFSSAMSGEWTIRRPLAQEMLDILSKQNPLKLVTMVVGYHVSTLLTQADLVLPEGMEILAREDIYERSKQGMKHPELMEVDLIIDDKYSRPNKPTLRTYPFGTHQNGMTCMGKDRPALDDYEMWDKVDGSPLSLSEYAKLYEDEGLLDIAQVMADFFDNG